MHAWGQTEACGLMKVKVNKKKSYFLDFLFPKNIIEMRITTAKNCRIIKVENSGTIGVEVGSDVWLDEEVELACSVIVCVLLQLLDLS